MGEKAKWALFFLGLGILAGMMIQAFTSGEMQAFQAGWDSGVNCVAVVAEDRGPLNASEIRSVTVNDCSVASGMGAWP